MQCAKLANRRRARLPVEESQFGLSCRGVGSLAVVEGASIVIKLAVDERLLVHDELLSPLPE